MDSDYIKDYWENQAKTFGDSHWSSWGDNWIIDLEIENIAKLINDGDSVLDVGCAGGYSTLKQFKKHQLQSIIGVDYAPSMIEAARKALEHGLDDDIKKIRFEEADIRELPFDSNSFDVVYTTRVLINLPTWEEQIKGIKECIRVAKPNGTVIFSEGFWEPLMVLNAFRLLVDLPSLVEHDFNRYLKQNKINQLMKELNLTYSIIDFSSVYYLGSRLLRELVTDYEQYEGFSNPINKIFAEIQANYSGGKVGIQQAVVIRK